MSKKLGPDRGVRNNNPGNIRITKDAWLGLADTQHDPAFFQFRAPVYGIRALSRILITYFNRDNLRTIRQVISRYAPGTENDTAAYIDYVAGRLGYDPDQVLDWFDLKPLTYAIIAFENGGYSYPVAVMKSAFELAGLPG